MRVYGPVLAVISLLTCLRPIFAAETICLKSGFCLEADSHSSTVETIVLHLGSGTLEYAAQDVASIQTSSVESGKKDTTIPPVREDQQLKPEDLLVKAAKQQGLGSNVDFVLSVAKIESGLRQSAVSNKGALGLMQLMPRTAAELGFDARIPAENAVGGAKYLRSLLIRYHGDSALALAAYNAGPGAVDRFHGMPPFEETRGYVVRVLREYQRERRLQAKARPTPERVTPRASALVGK